MFPLFLAWLMVVLAVVQSRRLFARAQAPKEMWEVPGAGHVDYHRAVPLDYEARVGGFLARHLRDGSR